jgi:hypothetical protein
MCTNLYVNDKDVFKFLNSYDHQLMLEHFDEIQKQSPLQEAEEPELSLNNRSTTVSKLSEGSNPLRPGSRCLRSRVLLTTVDDNAEEPPPPPPKQFRKKCLLLILSLVCLI